MRFCHSRCKIINKKAITLSFSCQYLYIVILSIDFTWNGCWFPWIWVDDTKSWRFNIDWICNLYLAVALNGNCFMISLNWTFVCYTLFQSKLDSWREVQWSFLVAVLLLPLKDYHFHVCSKIYILLWPFWIRGSLALHLWCQKVLWPQMQCQIRVFGSKLEPTTKL